MPDFLAAYGQTTGPLGVPCTDEQAFELDRICRSIAEPEVKRLHVATAGQSLIEGERTDESWISTEDVDRVGDVMLAKGMDPSHFLKNPVVTVNHCYYLPPVGRCLRLWEARSESARGVKALTKYPPRPDGHQGEWASDDAWYLVKSGLVAGKSVGFLGIERRDPDEKERQKGIRRVWAKWLLLEYSLCGLPTNPFAVTSGISKSMARALGLDVEEPKSWTPREPDAEPELIAPFTCLGSVEEYLSRSLAFDPAVIVEEAAADALRRHKGSL